MGVRLVVVGMVLTLWSGASAVAGCDASPDLSDLPNMIDRVPGPLVLSPMICADTPGGVRCVSEGVPFSAIVTAMFVGSATSAGVAERLLACRPDSASAECRFTINIDPTRFQAGRRADTPGWKLIEIRAEKIELKPARCR